MYRFNREPFGEVPRIDPMINKLSYLVQRGAPDVLRSAARPAAAAAVRAQDAQSRRLPAEFGRGEPLTVLRRLFADHFAAAGRLGRQQRRSPGSGGSTTRRAGGRPAEFEEFLSKGDTPIYLGFGSMPWGAQRNTEIITKAIAHMGRTGGDRQGLGRREGGGPAQEHLRRSTGRRTPSCSSM